MSTPDRAAGRSGERAWRGAPLAWAMLAGGLAALGACTAVPPTPAPPPTDAPLPPDLMASAAEPADAASEPDAAPAPPPQPVLPPPAPPPSPAALPSWNDDLRLMSPDALQREIARLSDTSDGPLPPWRMVRLAMALSQNRNDLPRAVNLLEQVQRSTIPEAQVWRGWARLLSQRFQELRRIDDQLDRQSQQIRDLQKKQEQLSGQIEALRAIERSMSPRTPASGASSAPAPSPARAPSPTPAASGAAAR